MKYIRISYLPLGILLIIFPWRILRFKARHEEERLVDSSGSKVCVIPATRPDPVLLNPYSSSAVDGSPLAVHLGPPHFVGN